MKRSPNAARELLEVAGTGDYTLADELMGVTDCPNGCVVEPDGHCPHGYESAGLTAQVI